MAFFSRLSFFFIFSLLLRFFSVYIFCHFLKSRWKSFFFPVDETKENANTQKTKIDITIIFTLVSFFLLIEVWTYYLLIWYCHHFSFLLSIRYISSMFMLGLFVWSNKGTKKIVMPTTIHDNKIKNQRWYIGLECHHYNTVLLSSRIVTFCIFLSLFTVRC